MSTNPPLPSWEDVRRGYVGGSEVGALLSELCGDDPIYGSRWQLWNRKVGVLDERDVTERMKWGNRHEATILRSVREDWREPNATDGWPGLPPDDHEWGGVVPWGEFVFHPGRLPSGAVFIPTVDRGGYLAHESGIGGTPDASIEPAGWPGGSMLECKAIDWLQFSRWERDEHDRPIVPLQYRLQGEVYCGLLGARRCVFAVLVGGNDLHRFVCEHDPEVFALICNEAREFWRSVREGIEPTPSLRRDADVIHTLWNRRPLTAPEDRSGDATFLEALSAYEAASAAKSAAEAAQKQARAALELAAGSASEIDAGDRVVRVSEIAGGPVSFVRDPYRKFTISKKKPAKGRKEAA